MATSDPGRILGERVPFALEDAESLSWAFGSDVVGELSECARVERTDGSGSVTAFEATDHTVVVRVRTAVGREKFYGLATADFRAALASLSGGWRVEYSAL